MKRFVAFLLMFLPALFIAFWTAQKWMPLDGADSDAVDLRQQAAEPASAMFHGPIDDLGTVDPADDVEEILDDTAPALAPNFDRREQWPEQFLDDAPVEPMPNPHEARVSADPVSF